MSRHGRKDAMRIDLPEATYALAESLARRRETTVLNVIHQALRDAEDLEDDIEMCEARKLNVLTAKNT